MPIAPTVYRLLGVLASAGLWVLAGAGPAQAQSIYTCVDAQGRRLTYDRPIASCTDREQLELNPSGTVKRRVGPTLTDRERQIEEERQRRAAEVQRQIDEDRRRDRALLARYQNPSQHDAERAEALRLLDDQIASGRERQEIIAKQRAELPDAAKRSPGQRQQAIELDRAAAAQQRYVDEREAQRTATQQRFDTELARLKELLAARAMPATR